MDMDYSMMTARGRRTVQLRRVWGRSGNGRRLDLGGGHNTVYR